MELKSYLDKNGYKLVKSIFCYLTFAGLGGVCSLLGSTLLDLQILIQEDFVTTSRLIPVRSVGYITGGIISGIIEQFVTENAVLTITNFTGGLFIIIAPWFTSLYGVAIFVYLSGVSQGLFDIYSNMYIIRIWGKDSTNYLQILHMSFGVGALIVPLMSRPFILPLSRDIEGGANVNETALIGGFSPKDVKIQYLYLITGLFLCIISIGFAVFYVKDRKTSSKTQTVAEKNVDDDEPPVDNWRKYTAVFPMTMIANIAFGVSTVVGSLGPAFVVKSAVQMSKQTGALILTVFWTVYSFYRLLFIPLTLWFPQRRLMNLNLLIILASVAVMIPKAEYDSGYTWAAFVLIGIGFSPTYSISLGLLQRYFPISGRMASFICMNGVVGESLHPWIVSQFMEERPAFFLYYLGGMCVAYVIINFSLPFLCDILFKERVGRPRRADSIATRT